MVIPEAAGRADPLAGGADQQVHDGLLGHSDRGQQAGPLVLLQLLLLVDLLIAQDWVAEVCIQLAGDDRRWSFEEADNNAKLVNECLVVIFFRRGLQGSEIEMVNGLVVR